MKEKAEKLTKLYFEILGSKNPPTDEQFKAFKECLDEIVTALERLYQAADNVEDPNPNQELSDLFSGLPVSVQFVMLRAYMHGAASNMLTVEQAQKAYFNQDAGGILDLITEMLGIKIKPIKPKDD